MMYFIDCGRWVHIDCVHFHESFLDVRFIAFVYAARVLSKETSSLYDWEESLIR